MCEYGLLQLIPAAEAAPTGFSGLNVCRGEFIRLLRYDYYWNLADDKTTPKIFPTY